jgi:hypothetical protein
MKPFAVFCSFLLGGSVHGLATDKPGNPVSFNRQIRPILSERCIKCHGGVKEAGGLNLQFREWALKGGKSGTPAIVPGDPGKSELMARLTTKDEDDRMPKKSAPLTPEQIVLLQRWIAEGALWEKHWAYEAPQKAGRSIDEIVRRRLKQEHLSVSAPADRYTLARRSALDLTGLPPSPEEVEAFVHDKSRDAYERWVDRLLASPSYGERWAAVWLDLARYADSKGYEKDSFRDMWRYRDWVIDALNKDVPYTQFLVEQLAGDLLPGPSEEQIIATAFHRNTPENDEGGTDDEEFRTYAVIDRLSTTFDSLQATTIGCVQCHGHPYDPFVHRDFYQLLAFFNNTADADRNDSSPTHRFYARPERERALQLEQKIDAAQKRIDTELARPENQQAFEAWLNELQPSENFLPLEKLGVRSTQGNYRLLDDGRVRLEGAAPHQTTIHVEGTPPPGLCQALVLAMIPDDTLPNRGPGGVDGGNFILTRFRATLIPAVQTPPLDVAQGQTQSTNVQSAPETELEFTNARATFEQGGWPIADALKTGPGKKKEGEGGWAIAGGTGKAQTATFFLAKPVEIGPGTKLRISLECENEQWAQHVLGSFRLALSRGKVSAKYSALPKDAQMILEKDRSGWTKEEKVELQQLFISTLNEGFARLDRDLHEDRKGLAALPVCNLPILEELPAPKARTTHVFHRGNWMDPGDPVEPATPKILNAWHEDYPRNRLGFARWLTSAENPLTARVQVNRLWEQLFGLGLVETLEDFGTQGSKPIYQDLLDELAVRFETDFGWSQKKLLREIVLSRTYCQSSKASQDLVQRDPENRLLARGPRFRLSSEQLRDQALALGGVLSHKMYGPPVMPFQPAGMWLTPYEGRDWATSPGEDGHRRALYTFIRRSATYPSFVTFDAPSREYCMVRRIRTNTPLQSLDLLNSPVFFEAAEGLAKRMAAETEGGLDAQLARGIRIAIQRPARPAEIETLKKLHQRVGGNLTLVANAIMNLDEVLNKN